MRALKIIGLALLIVLILLVILSYLLPKNIKVERSLFIKADAAVVFDQINTLKNWEQWSPWHKIDSLMVLTYSGPEAGKDAVYEWKSEHPNVGNGKLTILSSTPFDSIVVEMDFNEKGKSEGGFIIVKADSGVTLTWNLRSNLGNNPISRYFGLFMDKMIGPDFEKGLKSIKTISEAMPRYQVAETTFEGTEFLYIRDTCTMATITKKMEQYFGEIMTFIQSNKLKIKGYPFTRYYSWENNHFDIEVAIPVDKVKADPRILSGRLNTQKVAMVDYYGPYEKVESAYNALTNWMTSNIKASAGFPWESYVTDPMTEKDQNKWLTKIYWPIK
jgi:effector-binding domain-containing protein